MTAPKNTGKRESAGKVKAAKAAEGKGPEPGPEYADQSGGGATKDREERTITVTVPSFDRVASGAVNAAMLPVALARQVLPAKRGVPVYVGLGVLGAADVLEWPVAIGFGVCYAMFRRRNKGATPSGPGEGAPSATRPAAA
ncbi:hypothetical protein [Streptomyces purpureus]|uniref:Uncharacterized protein n=1 Tax=Streptomyces purpureus TaxID=1951 RepID=A0A918LS97_9ACTN|nr:hypothetical protein [Streptomyces purpureus]GGT45999.1 hypothetical protein GCM10014713_44890 [Streptomyces purpureus]